MRGANGSEVAASAPGLSEAENVPVPLDDEFAMWMPSLDTAGLSPGTMYSMVARPSLDGGMRGEWKPSRLLIQGVSRDVRIPTRRSRLATMKVPKKSTPRDVVQNAHRIFEEAIQRSEEPPNRGNLKVAPTPAKKTGATK